jgi:hypothetical protein
MKSEHPQVRQVELIRLKEAEVELLATQYHNMAMNINRERANLSHLKQELKRMMSAT